MSIFLGDKLLSGVATNTVSNAHSLFDFIWSDHIKNELSWLRADTFSWQSGSVYVGAYNHILADYSGGTSQTETVGSYTITYVLADDGHKITTDETTVANIYAESGSAWYYILDTVNTRFKLPRVNPAREELIQTVRAKGNGNTLGLIEGATKQTYSGVIQTGRGNYSSGFANIVSVNVAAGPGYPIGLETDSTRSGIISSMTDSISVYKGKKYLYFYVGNFSQSATEQTAGLNSSLFNGKMDTDLTNIDNTNNAASTALNTAGIRTVVETYQNDTDWYRIWSDGWCEQGGQFVNTNSSFSVNLLLPMANSTYGVLVTLGEANKNANYSIVIGGKTTNSFVGYMSNSNATYKSCWYAFGFKEDVQ